MFGKIFHAASRHPLFDSTHARVQNLSLVAVSLVADSDVFDPDIIVIIDAYPGGRAVQEPQSDDVPVHKLNSDIFSQFVIGRNNICIGAPGHAADKA